MSLDLNLYKARLDAYKVVGKEGKINSMKKAIADDFFNNPSHFEVSINDVIRSVHLIEETQKTYKILCMPDEEINAGEYVKLNGDIFLCLYRYPDNKVQSRGIIQETNHNLKWINENNQLITRHCIEDARTLYTTGVRDEKIIEIPNGMVGIQLPNDKETIQLNRGDAFIFNKTKYEVTFYDHTTYPGLIILICSEVSSKITERDDMENEIANRWDKEGNDRLGEEPTQPEPEPSQYTYTITAQTVFPDDPIDEIYWGDTVIYTVHKFDNGVEVDGSFTFELYQQSGEDWIQPVTIAEETYSTSNTINIKGLEGSSGYIKFVATDIETGEMATEMVIKIRGIMG